MNYYKKTKKPKRDDTEYKEMENFEDYELINNFCYEAAIRTKEVVNLTKKYFYCNKLFKKIKKVNWKEYYRSLNNEKYEVDEDSYFDINRKEVSEEQFEDALKTIEVQRSLCLDDDEINQLINKDFESFKSEIDISFLDKSNEGMGDLYNNILCICSDIEKIIKYKFYLELYTKSKKIEDVEYSESSEISLFKKREYRNFLYIETIIDVQHNRISKTVYPLPKRKLYTENILNFTSNHLFLPKESFQVLETFFNINEKKLINKKYLADCFFCYDYYIFRLKQVEKKNKKTQLLNENNPKIKELKELITFEKDKNNVNNNTKIRIYEKQIENEMIKNKPLPTLNKESKYFVFGEKDFKKSGINQSTALRYFQWISPYIKDLKYTNIINFNCDRFIS